MLAVIEELAPARIGHGVAAAGSEEAMRSWSRSGTCSRSARARTCARARSPDLAELGAALRAFETAGVRYTINTDGPYLLNTHLRREYQLLIGSDILTDAEAERSVAVSHAASFIR